MRDHVHYERVAQQKVTLDKAHNKFMEFINSQTETSNSPDKVYVENNELFIDCLGVNLQGKRRLLVSGSWLVGLEYRFFALVHEEEFEVWKMYMIDEYLYKDPEQKFGIGGFYNNSIGNNLLVRSANAILESDLVAHQTIA